MKKFCSFTFSWRIIWRLSVRHFQSQSIESNRFIHCQDTTKLYTLFHYCAKIWVKFCKQTRSELPPLLALSRYSLLTLSLYFIFPLWSVPVYELSRPAVDHAVCILRIASLLSACLTISLSHFLSFFPLPNPSFARSLSLVRSRTMILGQPRLGETRFAGSWNMLTFTGDRGPSTREWENREWRTRRD